jgi:hypothetical protein
MKVVEKPERSRHLAFLDSPPAETPLNLKYVTRQSGEQTVLAPQTHKPVVTGQKVPEGDADRRFGQVTESESDTESDVGLGIGVRFRPRSPPFARSGDQSNAT